MNINDLVEVIDPPGHRKKWSGIWKVEALTGYVIKISQLDRVEFVFKRRVKVIYEI